jgi:hypothetical protein
LTASALSKLSGHGFPLAALHVVAHDHPGPVLDLARLVGL